MKTVSIIIFSFFAVLSILIFFTKNYQYEKYVLVKKSNEKIPYKININLATWKDFASLPAISDSLAKKIIENRTEQGRFEALEDLKSVSGIGEKRFARIKEYLSTDI